MFLLLSLAVLSMSLHISFSSQLITFWQITDIHVDLAYGSVGDVDNHCHNNPPYNVILPPFGVSGCDAPYALAVSAIKAMKDRYAQPEFIIWTGDSTADLNDLSVDIVIASLANMTYVINSYFPDTKLYSVMGNHDYYKNNQLPAYTNRIYQAAAELWGKDLSSEAKYNLSQYGYYRQTMTVPANTILLGLNTNLNYDRDSATAGLVDPAGQFAFMEASLKAAKEEGKKVMVISHIPRGARWKANVTIHDQLVELLTVYADIIIGSYFGHMHLDQIYLTRSVPDDKVVGFLLVAPAVGEVSSPSIRLFSIDSETGDIRQMKQFYMSRSDANLAGTATWLERYTITVPEGKTFLQYIANYYELVKMQGGEELTNYYFS